jgi:hypothetical protein
VDDAAFVRRLECVGDLTRNRQRLVERQRAAADPRRQRFALDELHDQRTRPVGFFETVNVCDVAVIEGGEEFGLALEASQAVGIGGNRLWQDFQRDLPLQARVARPIDLAHAARPQEGDDFIRTDAGTGG